MRLALLFLLSTTVTLAEEQAIQMEKDGFAALTTLSFSHGQICRKLDTLKSQGCQTAIIQRTLVGPLKKGSWKFYGANSLELEKTVTYTGQRELKSTGEVYAFTLEKPAVLSAEAGRLGNKSGRCREFVPLQLSVTAGGKTKEIRAELGENPQPPRAGGVCQAMPQTFAHGAIEIAPGSYRIDNKDIKRVTLFLSP